LALGVGTYEEIGQKNAPTRYVRRFGQFVGVISCVDDAALDSGVVRKVIKKGLTLYAVELWASERCFILTIACNHFKPLCQCLKLDARSCGQIIPDCPKISGKV
jgi:hypothetical protein